MSTQILSPGSKKRMLERLQHLKSLVVLDYDREIMLFHLGGLMFQFVCCNTMNVPPKKKTKKSKKS